MTSTEIKGKIVYLGADWFVTMHENKKMTFSNDVSDEKIILEPCSVNLLRNILNSV